MASAQDGIATVVPLHPLEAVLRRLEGVTRTSRGHAALCPAHDDSKPSLFLWVQKGRVRFKCHAGCGEVDIAKALDIDPEQRVGRGQRTKREAPSSLTTEQVEAWHAALLADAA